MIGCGKNYNAMNPKKKKTEKKGGVVEKTSTTNHQSNTSLLSIQPEKNATNPVEKQQSKKLKAVEAATADPNYQTLAGVAVNRSRKDKMKADGAAGPPKTPSNQASKPSAETREDEQSTDLRSISKQVNAVDDPEATRYDAHSSIMPEIPSTGSAEKANEESPKLNMAAEDKKTIDMAPLKKANVPIFFIVGGPGSGKGTQCEKMAAKFGLTHLSFGDLLRAETKAETPRGAKLKEIMAAGQLVPMTEVLDLIKEAMLKAVEAGTKGFLIDGFPREVQQGELFEKEIQEARVVLYFDVSENTLVKRLLKRAETSGRADDNLETIKKRLATFNTATAPVEKYYQSKGKLIKISGEATVDEIFAKVAECLDRAMIPVPLLLDLCIPSINVAAAGEKLSVKLSNVGPTKLVYKVKSSNNTDFRVNPVFGIIAVKGECKLEIHRQAGPPKQDKIVIHYAICPEDNGTPEQVFKKATEMGELTISINAA